MNTAIPKSFKRAPKRYARNFGTTLDLAANAGCKVMPVRFNRWHTSVLDYGGIYIDHFLSRSSWVQRPGMFDSFLEKIVGPHAKDDRILAWDLCNEPFAYGRPQAEMPEIAKAEIEWLKAMYDACKRLGAAAPITVGIHPKDERAGIEQIEPISDVLSIHPYWIPKKDKPDGGKAEFEKLLDDYVAFAARVKKPLLATETCWGEVDDAKRVEIIRCTLTQLKRRNIGWLVYLLHHSLRQRRCVSRSRVARRIRPLRQRPAPSLAAASPPARPALRGRVAAHAHPLARHRRNTAPQMRVRPRRPAGRGMEFDSLRRPRASRRCRRAGWACCPTPAPADDAHLPPRHATPPPNRAHQCPTA